MLSLYLYKHVLFLLASVQLKKHLNMLIPANGPLCTKHGSGGEECRVKFCGSVVDPRPPHRQLGRARPSFGNLEARKHGDDNDFEMQQQGRRAENGQQVGDLLQQSVHILKGGAPGGSTPVMGSRDLWLPMKKEKLLQLQVSSTRITRKMNQGHLSESGVVSGCMSADVRFLTDLGH